MGTRLSSRTCPASAKSTSSISTSKTTWTQPFDHLLMHMPHAVDFQHIYIEDYMDSAIRPLAHAYATCRRLPACLHRRLHGLSHSTTCSCICHMPSTSSMSTSKTTSKATWTQPFDHLLMHVPHAVDFQHVYIEDYVEDYMDSAIRPLAHACATCRMFRDAQVRLAVSGRFTLSVKYTSLICRSIDRD